MIEFIHNPRHSPRIPVRCSMRIALRTGAFLEARTYNVGLGGCGVETPCRVEPGERAFAEVGNEQIGSRLLTGRVAWSASAPPWRSGIAFDEGSRRAAAELFSEIVAACPDATIVGEVVDKIPTDAVLTPTPAPGALQVVPAEAEVLEALGGGMQAGALRDRLGERWGPCVNALFSLIERCAVAVGPAAGGGTPANPARAT